MNLFARIGLFLLEMTIVMSAAIMIFRWQNRRLWALCGATCLAAWLFFIFSVTLNGPYSDHPFSAWNLIPFQWIGEMIQELQSGKSVLLEIWHIPKQLMANVLMFIPGGFLLAVVCPRIRHWKGIVICGAGCSAAIEIIQFFIGRIADIDDVLMNSLGAAIGFALFQWGWREIQKSGRFGSRNKQGKD